MLRLPWSSVSHLIHNPGVQAKTDLFYWDSREIYNRKHQHRGTLLEDSVQRSWAATFFRIFVFFLYPEKYGGSKTVLKSEIGLVDHIQKK